ncbi:MAG TPA: ATP-binding protein [Myxococcota bacterium]|nr:ATP-binding protein [Myxococcota bacterium]
MSDPRPPDPRCPRCHGRGYERHEGPDGDARALPCACRPPCSACAGVGMLDGRDAQGYAVVRPCACRAFDTRLGLFNSARIPSACWQSEFHEPPPAFLLDKHVQRAWTHAQRFATAFEARAAGFLLHGGPGTLKTTIVCATLAYLTLDRGIDCRFIEFSLLLNQIREGIGGDAPTQRLEPLRRATVLAIDELGKMRATEWERTVLDDLIQSRYQARRTTLFATNFPVPAEPDAAAGGSSGAAAAPPRPRPPRASPPASGALRAVETLEDAVGGRIYSRLRAMGEFVHTGQNDLRRRRDAAS